MIMELQGVTTSVNIPMLFTVLGTAIVIGGIIWRLAERIAKLESKQEAKAKELNDKIDANGKEFNVKVDNHSKEFNGKVDKLESDIRHLIDIVELKMQHSNEKDSLMLSQITLMQGDVKTMLVDMVEVKHKLKSATKEE